MLQVEINSLSSSLMLGVTLYRNRQDAPGKLLAQVGYGLIPLVAAVETVAALAFSALSLAIYPWSREPFEHASKWLDSSLFSFGWSAVDFLLNLFVTPLIADEETARLMVQRRDIQRIPHRAII